jgi:acetyltransferase
MQSGEYDAVALLCIPPATILTADVARGVVTSLAEMDPAIPRLPLLSCFFGPNLGAGAREVLNAAGYPCLEYPEQIAEILTAIQGREVRQRLLPVRSSASRLKEIAKYMYPAPDGYLPQNLAWKILETCGFRIAAPLTVSSGSDLAGTTMSYPVVAKIDHPDIIHKSDAGGVILDIQDEDSAGRIVEELLGKFPGARGVTIQEQVTSTHEMILGSVRDEAAGTAVMVGLGGVSVELMQDVSFIHVPFSREDAKQAVLALKSAPLLTGYRGKPGVNLDSLLDHMERLNNLLLEFPAIREMDLNPLMYSPKDGEFIIADCRIRLS